MYGFGGLVWYVAFDGIAVKMDARTKMSKRLQLKLIFPVSDLEIKLQGLMNRWYL